MEKRNIETDAANKEPPELKHFQDLEGLVESRRHGNMDDDPFFEINLRAAFAKCFDFNVAVRESLLDPRVVFCLPSLRGICEDLIVFGFLKQIDVADRDRLLRLLATHGMATRARIQSDFFATVRPQQKVIHRILSDSEITDLENEIRSIWKANGWANLNRGVMPKTRQIAEKQGSDILLCLYDFLYRLTSGTVHFDVQSLVRTGWGEHPEYTFSTQHFNLYYAGFARAYGAFLFVSYFEMFPDLLSTTEEETASVDAIRDWLNYVPRWPEMVTFEELNIKPPEHNIFVSATIATIQKSVRPRLLG